jgi:hypothetical protein
MEQMPPTDNDAALTALRHKRSVAVAAEANCKL